MPAAPHILRLPLRNPGHGQKGHVLVAITPTESDDDDEADPESRPHSRSLDLELVATDSLKAYVMTCECRPSSTWNLSSGADALILLPPASQAPGQGQPYLWRRNITCAAFPFPAIHSLPRRPLPRLT